ncbi:hypothetical protein D8S78_15260 [Natrialba swarupiae]|nr:hypothetical protein [Natrialba swarupiae]
MTLQRRLREAPEASERLEGTLGCSLTFSRIVRTASRCAVAVRSSSCTRTDGRSNEQEFGRCSTDSPHPYP